MKDNFTFLHPIRVRWAECDAQGIVFNANYFLYFDVAMTEYMRGLGFTGEKMLEFLTVHAEADYRGSARFDDMVDAGVRCARLGRTSMILKTGVFRGDETLTEGLLTYVHVDPSTYEKTQLPEEFVARILAFEKAPPER